LIAAGAKGFMIVPSDSTAIVPTIKKARDAGLLVIVLDTAAQTRSNAADATFATDNSRPRIDRLLGRQDPRRQGQGRQESPSSTSRRTSPPSTICATRAS